MTLAWHSLEQFAHTAESVAATTKKLEKARLLGEYFEHLDDDDLARAARYFAGQQFAQSDMRTTNVGGSILSEAMCQATGVAPETLGARYARWVDAGKYVTSAGVSAGTDLAFYLVSRMAGRAVAELAALSAEYDWHRDPQAPIFYPQQAEIKGAKDSA